MVTRITPKPIISFFETPSSCINVTPVVVKMLYLYPWEFRPLLELLFRGFFDEEADETNLFKGLDGVIVKVIFPPRPDDSVNSKFNQVFRKAVK